MIEVFGANLESLVEDTKGFLYCLVEMNSHDTRLDGKAQTLDRMTNYQYIVHHKFTHHVKLKRQ